MTVNKDTLRAQYLAVKKKLAETWSQADIAEMEGMVKADLGGDEMVNADCWANWFKEKLE